jgi:hypothetical protein
MNMRKTLLAALVALLSIAGSAHAGERQQARSLAAIKRAIGFKGDTKATSWYVIQLETVTTTSISSKSISYRSSVMLKKVQGQDAAAQMILDFVNAPGGGTKYFIVDAFADTEKGRQNMEKYISYLNESGRIKGYR